MSFVPPSRVAAAVTIAVLVAGGALAHAGTDPADACRDTKAKAAGKKAGALLKAYGKDAKKEDPVKLAASISKAQSKFTKSFNKAESKGGCLTTGDAGAIEAKVDAFVDDILLQIPLGYGGERFWLCKPGMADNQCFVNDIDATVVAPDNSTTVESHQGSEEHPFDCFYIYPTVDLTGPPGNHSDFSSTALELDPLLGQAARLNDTCRIFAPLYRQITFSSFGNPNAGEFLDNAYRDVEAAWNHYLAEHNDGRNFVIVGHSQGTFMTTRLIEENIDDDPVLRSRMIVALLIGGSVVVPDGQAIGGTFQNIPLCTSASETNCAVAYRTYAESHPPAGGSNIQDPVLDTACVNPVAQGGGPGMANAYLAQTSNQPLFLGAVDDAGYGLPFVRYDDFYEVECVKDADNRSYLEIRPRPGVGDVRADLVNYGDPVLSPALLGTHILDYHFVMGDLVDLVEAKAAAMP
jgi:pimeloyl-ACP methyl ester carboxylesterase